MKYQVGSSYTEPYGSVFNASVAAWQGVADPVLWPPLGRGFSGRSERILVLAPAAWLRGLRLRRPLEQHGEEGRDKRIGRHHRVGVVNSPVLARKRDVARALAEAVLERGANLLRPFLQPARRDV